MAISGPFGTFGALTWPGGRCIGRSALAAMAGLAGAGIDLDQRSWRRPAVVAIVIVANLVVAAITVVTVWSLEGWLLPARQAALSLIEIYFYALTIGQAVSAVVTPIRQRQTMAAMAVDRPDSGQDTFFARLPPHIGDDLVHLRMRDHYIEVTTAAGRDLVLMRFADALAAAGVARAGAPLALGGMGSCRHLSAARSFNHSLGQRCGSAGQSPLRQGGQGPPGRRALRDGWPFRVAAEPRTECAWPRDIWRPCGGRCRCLRLAAFPPISSERIFLGDSRVNQGFDAGAHGFGRNRATPSALAMAAVKKYFSSNTAARRR